MPGPLDGVRIIEFGQIIAGPYGAMLLADMGADVIKIEPPWGEPWRFSKEISPFESRTFISLNRGKRSLPLDLAKKEATEITHKLVSQADVVIINFRPDVPYKLRIDYETLSKINPRLIYCENTAFGRLGPDNNRPGYDLIVQAMSGLMASDGKISNGAPQQITATAVSDFSTGLAIAWGVCTALYSRERTGLGQKIESTLLGSALSIQTSSFVNVQMVDDQPRAEFLETLERMRQAGSSYEDVHTLYQSYRTQPTWNAYYRTYQTKDSVIAVGCLSDTLRKKMSDALGFHDIRFDPSYVATNPEVEAFNVELAKTLERLFMTRTTTEWLQILDSAGVPSGPVRFVEELLNDPQVVANGLVVELEHNQVGPIKMAGPMLSMSETPLQAKTASPSLGQHTDEVLKELGYSTTTIQQLKATGVTR